MASLEQLLANNNDSRHNTGTSPDPPWTPPPNPHNHTTRSFPRSSSSSSSRRGGSRRSLASHCSASRRSVLSTGSTAWELENLTSASIHSGNVLPHHRPDNPVPFLEQPQQCFDRSLSLNTLGTSNTSGTLELPRMTTIMTANESSSSGGTMAERPSCRPVARRWNNDVPSANQNGKGKRERIEL